MSENGKIPNKQAGIFEFAEFSFDASGKILRRGSATVSLAPKTCEILAVLLENAPELITKEELMNRVWADTFVEESNLAQHISALRKALGEDKNGRKFIETIPRKGYRFITPVISNSEEAAEIIVRNWARLRVVEDAAFEIEAPAIETDVQPQTLPSGKNRRWLKIAAASVSAIAVLAAFGYAAYKYLNPAPRGFSVKTMTRLTSSGRVKGAAISPDGKFIAYALEELDRRQSLRIRHIGSDSETPVIPPAAIEFVGLAVAPDGNAIYYLDANGALFQIPTLGGTARKIAAGLHVFNALGNTFGVAPDGRQIAFVRRFENDKSAIFIAQSDGGGERLLASFDLPNKLGQSVAWSPDGKLISCVVSRKGMHNYLMFDLDGNFAHLLPQDISNPGSQTWMPDSKSLLAGGDALEIISYPSGSRKVIADEDWDNYFSLSLTADGNLLSVVKFEMMANLWTMPSGDASRLRQITTGTKNFEGNISVRFMPDGKILHNSAALEQSHLKITDIDGANSKQIVKDSTGDTISPDNRFLYYQKYSDEPSREGIYQMDLSDGSEKQLTTGIDTYTTLSPDGKTLYYTRFGEHIGIWKVSVEGGDAQEFLAKNALCPIVSPDSKTIAFILREPQQPNRIAVANMSNGEIIKTFAVEIAPPVYSNKQPIQWTADGTGIYFLAAADNGANIWRQPLDDSPPTPVTNLKDGRIFNFAFSSDEKQIAFSRGAADSNLVLIENAE